MYARQQAKGARERRRPVVDRLASIRCSIASVRHLSGHYGLPAQRWWARPSVQASERRWALHRDPSGLYKARDSVGGPVAHVLLCLSLAWRRVLRESALRSQG